ncbi:hypothetical protein WJX82_002102 [Trebouxia sp. C0006]
MALGAWLLYRTTLIHFKFFRELVGQGAHLRRLATKASD